MHPRTVKSLHAIIQTYLWNMHSCVFILSEFEGLGAKPFLCKSPPPPPQKRTGTDLELVTRDVDVTAEKPPTSKLP